MVKPKRVAISTTTTQEDYDFVKGQGLKFSNLLDEVIGWKREDSTGSNKVRLNALEKANEQLTAAASEQYRHMEILTDSFKKFLNEHGLNETFKVFSGREL